MKIILVILIYFISSFPILANPILVNDSTDFPDSNYSWNESLFYSDTEFNDAFDDIKTFYDAGDTMIDGKNYRKLMQILVHRKYYISSNWPYYELRYINNSESLYGCIYNDKNEKKVYIRLTGDTLDKKLFDFSYRLGDIVDLDFFLYPDQEPLYVVKIDSILDPLGISRKYFKFSTNLSDTLDPQNAGFITCMIEGLGMGKGISNRIYIPFERWHYSFGCINLSPTIKFNIDDQLMIDHVPVITLADSCNPTRFEFMNTNFIKNNPITLYPNPSTGLIQIDTKDIVQCIKIYDQSSRLILTKNNPEYNSLDVSHLTNGFYYCIIITEDKVLNGKFLKE